MTAQQLRLPHLGQAFEWRSPGETTFVGQLNEPIHRWFRLTASYAPELVRDILDHFGVSQDDCVLDPFCGVGTTLLVCQERGASSVGVEINPFLAWVSRVKIRDYSSHCERLSQAVTDFMNELEQSVMADRSSGLDNGEFFDRADYAIWIPAIHNVFRWWSPTVLRQLVLSRMCLSQFQGDSMVHDFLHMGLHGVLIDISNIKRSRVSLSFGATIRDSADLITLLRDQYGKMLSDVASVQRPKPDKAVVLDGDARSLTTLLKDSRPATCIVTSPPYPNRFSYVRETRPHLFFGEFICSASQVGDLEMNTIGGTWGRATSTLEDYEPLQEPRLRALIDPVANLIRPHGAPMANYVQRYYDAMWEHAQNVAAITETGVQMAYVIGNSKFYGVELPADELLARVFELQGFEAVSIVQMRRRNSKRGLRECVVFMRKAV